MNSQLEEISHSDLQNADNYDIDTFESEIRADRYCTLLLKEFHQWLVGPQQQEPLHAGLLAAGADYFLREFIIGARRQNIYRVSALQLRQFGGNWYIISNLEPNMAELEPMLQGVAQFYAYCASQGLSSPETAAAMLDITNQGDFFKQRIEDFHNLQDDGYTTWDQACPLK